MSSEIEKQLESVGLRKPPYWDARYLKNVDKLSRPIYKVKEERDVYVPMRDGVKICVDIFRPDADGKFPALVAWSSYSKDIQTMKIPPQTTKSFAFDHFLEAGDIKFFVSRGYAYIIAEARGTGKSEGEWYGAYNPVEQQDVCDLIEWTAEQPWCDGNVGMIGISWFGIIQRLAAIKQPPHLKAIFPIEAFSDLYEHSCTGGMTKMYYWVLENEINAHTPKSWSEKIYTKEEMERRIKERLEDPDIQSLSYVYSVFIQNEKLRKHCWIFDVWINPLDGPFWRERSVYDKLDKIKIPVYCGDIWGGGEFIAGTIETFADQSLDVPKKLGLLMDYPTLKLPGIPQWNPEILRWYDHWLKGTDTGIMDEPPIKLLVTGVNKYRYEYEYPLARTKWTKFYLRRHELLAPEPEEAADLFDCFVHYPPTVSNKIETLTYSTPPITEPLEVTGPVTLHLHASIDQDDANFFAKLYDVSPDGKKTSLDLISFGCLRASFRALDEKRSKPWRPYHDYTKRVPVKPGEINEYAIFIGHFSRVFLPGHRIQLEVKSMDPAPYIEYSIHKIGALNYLPSSKLTYYRIYHDATYPSHLVLPIIPETPENHWIK